MGPPLQRPSQASLPCAPAWGPHGPGTARLCALCASGCHMLPPLPMRCLRRHTTEDAQYPGLCPPTTSKLCEASKALPKSSASSRSGAPDVASTPPRNPPGSAAASRSKAIAHAAENLHTAMVPLRERARGVTRGATSGNKILSTTRKCTMSASIPVSHLGGGRPQKGALKTAGGPNQP